MLGTSVKPFLNVQLRCIALCLNAVRLAIECRGLAMIAINRTRLCRVGVHDMTLRDSVSVLA
jgi:hypothetical protein